MKKMLLTCVCLGENWESNSEITLTLEPSTLLLLGLGAVMHRCADALTSCVNAGFFIFQGLIR